MASLTSCRSSCSETCIEVDVIDDTNDGGVHRRRLFSKRLARRAAFEHHQHSFVHARADAVHRQQGRPARRVVGIQRLDEQELGALELAVLLRRDHRADHFADRHAMTGLKACTTLRGGGFHMPVIDDADDAGVDGGFDGIKGKARFLAAHEEDFLADARADRIDRDQRAAGGLTLRRQRLNDQELQPRQVFVFAGHDNIPDYPCEVHQDSWSSMVSMMPTMAASTGQSFMPDAMRAELPETMSTVSPTPASTVSTATRKLPSGVPCGSIGLAISSLLLTSRSSFRVATTV